MEKKLYALLNKVQLDFLLQHTKKEFLEKAAISWSFSLKKTGLKIDEEMLDDIYTYGLKKKCFTYGFNLQSFIAAAELYLTLKNNKLEKKII